MKAHHEGSKEERSAAEGLKAEQAKVIRLEELNQALENQSASQLERLNTAISESNRYAFQFSAEYHISCAVFESPAGASALGR